MVLKMFEPADQDFQVREVEVCNQEEIEESGSSDETASAVRRKALQDIACHVHINNTTCYVIKLW